MPSLLKHLGADYKNELIGERLLTTPKNYAYLKISEGCDRPCSFCAIPLMRGKHRSTPIEDLVTNAKSLAKKGVKEINLLGQNVNSYRDSKLKTNLGYVMHQADAMAARIEFEMWSNTQGNNKQEKTRTKCTLLFYLHWHR